MLWNMALMFINVQKAWEGLGWKNCIEMLSYRMEMYKKVHRDHPETVKEATKRRIEITLKVLRKLPKRLMETTRKLSRQLPKRRTGVSLNEGYKRNYRAHTNLYKKRSKVHYAVNKQQWCKSMRDCYKLSAPNDCKVKDYLSRLYDNISENLEMKLCATMRFKKIGVIINIAKQNKLKSKLACCMETKRLLHEVLNICKWNAGILLKQVREINAQE